MQSSKTLGSFLSQSLFSVFWTCWDHSPGPARLPQHVYLSPYRDCIAPPQPMWGHNPTWDNHEERRNYLTSIFDQVKIPLSCYHHGIYPSISSWECEITVYFLQMVVSLLHFHNCSDIDISCTLARGSGHYCSSNQQENHCRDFRNQVCFSNLLITIIKAN